MSISKPGRRPNLSRDIFRGLDKLADGVVQSRLNGGEDPTETGEASIREMRQVESAQRWLIEMRSYYA